VRGTGHWKQARRGPSGPLLRRVPVFPVSVVPLQLCIRAKPAALPSPGNGYTSKGAVLLSANTTLAVVS